MLPAMPDSAQEVAARIIAALPCSIELPAGAGKTELIAIVAARQADAGKRCLLLTHTHAGVDALRRRLRLHDVPQRAATVHTIDGWCFDLVRHFPLLSALNAPADPDWSRSAEYHEAAMRAVRSPAIQRMLRVSYEMVVVDEYQDCVAGQRALVTALTAALPTIVLGDRLQGLFSFSSEPPVSWAPEVVTTFPPHTVDVVPWRWRETNAALGAWLLSIREPLMHGEPISLVDAPVHWRSSDDGAATRTVCMERANPDRAVSTAPPG